MSDFDTLKKVNPPLRTEEDRLALWKGLKEGVIQGVVSDHHPVEVENKDLEFDQAAFGSIGIETLAVAFLTEATKQGLEKSDRFISHFPASFLGFQLPELKVGDLMKGIIIVKEDQEYEMKSIVSKSKNSIFLGHTFSYKIQGVYADLI